MKIVCAVTALLLVAGGTVAGTGNASATTTVPASFFSGECTAGMRWAGNVGVINAQFSTVTRYLQWSATMYDPAANAGRWVADIYVGKRRVDHKDQDYNPHGSVAAVDMRSGQRLSFVVQHFDAEGRMSFSDPDAGCDIP